MRCPNCQTINPPGAKFCLECGQRLLTCPNCGTLNPPNAKFCIECGTRLLALGKSDGGSSNHQGQPGWDDGRSRSRRQNAADGQLTQPLPDILATPEERRVVTVMFADITGSTPLGDHMEPEDLRAILTGYFNLMTEQIRKHDGTVEKYIGDAIMAVFGAPIAHEDDPERAIRAALDMQAALARFNTQRQARDPEATRLQMRIGINTGEVAAPNTAEYTRQDFLITGDAVNVASRLQTVATPDTILVGERTYLSTREIFDFEPLPPLQIRGKAEPLHAWIAVQLRSYASRIAQHPRGIEGLQAQLIGRTLELDLMRVTYQRVQEERRPHLITILGEPGIGKSRLVSEFIAQQQQMAQRASASGKLATSQNPRVLIGRCPPYGEGITYRPLIEILNSLLQIQDEENVAAIRERFSAFVRELLERARTSEDPEQVASAIIRSVGGGGPLTNNREHIGSQDRERQHSAKAKNAEQSGPQMALLRAWRIFLEALAQAQPLIIYIDDLQWADEALLDLLEYLIERLSDVPVLFICPARADFLERRRDWGGGRKNFTTLILESLSREETSALVDALLKSEDLPSVLRFTILSRAEGNPFFVEEIVRMLIDQHVLVKEDGHWRVGADNEAILSELASPSAPPEDTLLDLHYVFPLPRVPDTIQGVLAARIDLLSQSEKQVLQHAAIIGRTFWLSALLELATDLSEENALALLNSLLQRDFIALADKEIRSPVEHDRVFIFMHVLIRDVVYNNIPRTRRSQEHTQLALWLEEKAGSNVKAYAELLAYHYQQALITWSPNVVMPFLPLVATGEVEAAATHLTHAELRRRAIIYIALAGDQAMHSYFTIRAIQAYSEALELLAESHADSLALAQMHEKLGHAYTQRGTLDEAWPQFRQALQLLLAEHPEKKQQLLYLYDHLAELGSRWLGLFISDPDKQEVRSYIEAGLQLLQDQPDSGQYADFLTYLAFWYANSQLQSTELQERAECARLALESGSEARRIAEKLNHTGSLWITLDALGFIYRKQHKYLEAHTTHHQRLTLEDKIQSREEHYDLYYSLGWAHEALGDYPTSVRWFGRSWHIAQTMESPPLLLNSMIGRMFVWYEWSRWNDAQEAAKGILQIVRQYQYNEQWQVSALETLAILAYRMGRQEEGDGYMRQFRRLVEQYFPSTETASQLASLYLARDEWERALVGLQEKLQSSEPFPSPKVLSTLAELAVMTGKRTGIGEDIQGSYCERAVVVAEQSGSRRSLATALRARGRMYLDLLQWEAAEEDLKRANAICKELDLVWDMGRALYVLGLLYRRRADALHQNEPQARDADIGRAHYHFEKALGYFDYLKAVSDAERARLALQQDTRAPV